MDSNRLRAWLERFAIHLCFIGFQASSADPSLFVWQFEEILIILLLYVDDTILTGNNSNEIQSLICQLAKAFAKKDLGPLNYFLGLEVSRTKYCLFLSQTKYGVDLLRKLKMDGAKPYSSPVISSAN